MINSLNKYVILLFLISPFLIYGQSIKKSDIIEMYKGVRCYIHFVDKGQTLISIASEYSVSIDELKEYNSELNHNSLKENQILKIPVMPSSLKKSEALQNNNNKHIVKAKETWFGIAKQYNISIKELKVTNLNIDTLHIGDILNIPIVNISDNIDHKYANEANIEHIEVPKGYKSHLVKPEETIYGISKKYFTTIEQLISINPDLKNGLRVGAIIVVPDDKPSENLLIKKDKTNEYIMHDVLKKETLYSISKEYNVTIDDIKDANPDIKNSGLKANTSIKIPKKQESIIAISSIDTIQAIDLEDLNNCKYEKNYKHFVVSLLIPLDLSNSDKIADENSSCFDFIQFYESALIAIKEHEEDGMKLTVNTYDVDFMGKTTKVRDLIYSNKLANSNLIIGPFFSESFSIVSDYAKKNKIPIVNPLSVRKEILNSNPFIFKIQPSKSSEINETIKFINKSFNKTNILSISANEQVKKELNKICADFKNNSAISNYTALESNSTLSRIKSTLSTNLPNIILLYSTDIGYLTKTLHGLNGLKNSYDITVFGDSEWANMEVDLKNIQNLNTHFAAPYFIDYNSKQTKNFIAKFKTIYGFEPDQGKYAYNGYDIVNYFLNALYMYGDDFYKCNNIITPTNNNSIFSFSKQEDGGFDNNYVTIFKFENYKPLIVN